VYIAAFGLDEGESIDALSNKDSPKKRVPPQYVRHENGFLWIDQDGSQSTCAERPVEAALWLRCKSSEHQLVHRKSGTTSLKHLPSWYMAAHGRHMIPRKPRNLWQREWLPRSASSCESCSTVSHLERLRELITSAAQSIS